MAEDFQYGFYRDIQLNNGAMVVSVEGGGGGSGTSGTSGTNGTSGSNGTSGTSGSNGTSGTAGTSGTSPAGGGSTGGVQFNRTLSAGLSYNTSITGVYEQFGVEGGSIWCNPFIPGKNISISGMTVDMFNGTAGAEIKLLVYSHDVVNDAPSTLLVESTTIDVSSGGLKQYNVNYTFSAGTQYWLGFATNSTAGGLQMRGITQGSCYGYGVPEGGGSSTVYTMIRSYTFGGGGWPAIASTWTTFDKNGARIPEIRLKISA